MFRNYQFDPKDPAQTHGFDVHDTDLSIVNGIRRIILTDVEVVGFSGEEDPSLEVVKNTGRLHNEIILHRFGLIPIHLSEEETDGFTDGSYAFELHVQNKTEDTLNVTTHSFKVTHNDRPLQEKEVKNMFKVDMVSKDPILITRLRPHEELHMKGEAVKRTARFHAGFSPVSLCTFSYIQDPTLAAAATNVLDKERAYMRNGHGDPIAFHFEIEPKIDLSPRYLVAKACEIIIQKLQTILQEVYQEESEKITIEEGDTGGVNFTFKGEDDTIGNILQSYLHVNFVRAKKHAPSGDVVKYAGYYCPHPLDDTMILNIRLDNETVSPKDHMDVLAMAARNLITDMQEMLNAWLRFAPKNNV
jgi:DNA-directed RNA polymerase subunit L